MSINNENTIVIDMNVAKYFKDYEIAAYIKALNDIIAKAKRKKCITSDGWFLIDREYIEEMYIIPIERQLLFDIGLSNNSLMMIDPNNVNRINFSSVLLDDRIDKQDLDRRRYDLVELAKVFKSKTKNTASKAESDKIKKESICINIVNYVMENNSFKFVGNESYNERLRNAVTSWVSSIVYNEDRPKLTNPSADLFVKTIFDSCVIRDEGSISYDADTIINTLNYCASCAMLDGKRAVKSYVEYSKDSYNIFEEASKDTVNVFVSDPVKCLRGD